PKFQRGESAVVERGVRRPSGAGVRERNDRAGLHHASLVEMNIADTHRYAGAPAADMREYETEFVDKATRRHNRTLFRREFDELAGSEIHCYPVQIGRHRSNSRSLIAVPENRGKLTADAIVSNCTHRSRESRPGIVRMKISPRTFRRRTD